VEADFVALQLLNEDGAEVDSWKVSLPDYDPEHEDIETADPDGDWRLLYGLFSEVHRRVLGWDKVVSDVEKALADSSTIGVRQVGGNGK
jgi:hypothetical protein